MFAPSSPGTTSHRPLPTDRSSWPWLLIRQCGRTPLVPADSASALPNAGVGSAPDVALPGVSGTCCGSVGRSAIVDFGEAVLVFSDAGLFIKWNASADVIAMPAAAAATGSHARKMERGVCEIEMTSAFARSAGAESLARFAIRRHSAQYARCAITASRSRAGRDRSANPFSRSASG